jgi:hypothetical protein
MISVSSPVASISVKTSMRAVPTPQNQRSGGSLTIYEKEIPTLLHALNPAKVDELLLSSLAKGQAQPSREQYIKKILHEFNTLSEEGFNLVRKPDSNPIYGTTQLHYGNTQVFLQYEDMAAAVPGGVGRNVFTAAVFPRQPHPENPFTIASTTHRGEIANLYIPAERNDTFIDVAIVNRLMPKLKSASYRPLPENPTDYERFSQYAPRS